jgi:hypothetical protein
MIMSRRLMAAILTSVIGLNPSARAQMPETPGPGGIRIAPGAPITGFTPGGIGPGGIDVAPGPAARGVPMYRIGPGGIPLAPQPDPRPERDNPVVRLQPDCTGSTCVPEIPQTLALTINSRDASPGQAPSPDATIDSINELFAALRSCWEPPAREQAQEGVQMSVRFSFRRTGDIMAPPFVTYTTPGTKDDTKQVYRRAINAALERCAPLRFSRSFSAAIAGRPVSIRYVDDRTVDAGSRQP